MLGLPGAKSRDGRLRRGVNACKVRRGANAGNCNPPRYQFLHPSTDFLIADYLLVYGIAVMDESRLSPRAVTVRSACCQSYFDHLLRAALSVPQNGFDFHPCNDNPL
jgi:hypothetical protein